MNSNLRKLIALAGGLFLLLHFISRIGEEVDDNDGFQIKEFDDIW